jgi:cytochrome c553
MMDTSFFTTYETEGKDSMRTRFFSLTRLLVLAGLTTCMIGGFWATGSFSQELPGNPKNGKLLYENHCANCHGEKGNGDGPDTRFLIVLPANFHSLQSRMKTDEDLMTIITFGAAFSPMHGWANRLTESERWDILRYIRLLAPFNPVAFELCSEKTHKT